MAKTAKPAAAKPATKSEIYAKLADKTGLSKKQVGEFFGALEDVIKGELGKKGPGSFALPGLCRMNVVVKPATKARKGINPFTKEEVMFKAKPASKNVKIRPLKNLKELVK